MLPLALFPNENAIVAFTGPQGKRQLAEVGGWALLRRSAGGASRLGERLPHYPPGTGRDGL